MLGEKIVTFLVEHRSVSLAAVAASAVTLWGAGSGALGEITNVTYGSEAAETYLEHRGYTNAELQGVNYFPETMNDCDADNVEYTFIARNAHGVRKDVDVCKRLGISPELVVEG